MTQKYQHVKQEIQLNLAELQQVLNRAQFEEINSFLADRYKAEASFALNKGPRRQQQKPDRKPQPGKSRNIQRARRPQNNRPANPNNNQLQKLFMGLINSL